MITRIVKLTFIPGSEAEFLRIYTESSARIRSFEGCSHLELLRDVKQPNVFFTYSYWQHERHLESYRNSDLFRSVWEKVSVLFAAEAEAWTTEKQYADETNG